MDNAIGEDADMQRKAYKSKQSVLSAGMNVTLSDDLYIMFIVYLLSRLFRNV